LVSHDRYLINRLATQIWEIRQKKLIIFSGSYRAYILHTANAGPAKQNTARQAAARQTILPQKRMVRGDSFESRKQIEALERLENRIREQEVLVQRLSHKLQTHSPVQNYEKVNELSWQMAQAQADLERMMMEWERLAVH
jgi:ATPase subunit of ABC transporter with duplicated ATPase domains